MLPMPVNVTDIALDDGSSDLTCKDPSQHVTFLLPALLPAPAVEARPDGDASRPLYHDTPIEPEVLHNVFGSAWQLQWAASTVSQIPSLLQ